MIYTYKECINKYKTNYEINLTAKEFQILTKLMKKPEHVVTREQLEESLYAWGDEIESNAIEVYIYQLRKKIGNQRIKTLVLAGLVGDEAHGAAADLADGGDHRRGEALAELDDVVHIGHAADDVPHVAHAVDGVQVAQRAVHVVGAKNRRCENHRSRSRKDMEKG